MKQILNKFPDFLLLDRTCIILEKQDIDRQKFFRTTSDMAQNLLYLKDYFYVEMQPFSSHL